MKKIVLVLLVLGVFLLLHACSPVFGGKTTAVETTAMTELSLPVYMPGSIEINHEQDYGEGDNTNYKRSYRRIYYVLPGALSNLVDPEAYCAYSEEFWAHYSGEEITEMFMVTFIKRFNIPKSQFIKAFEEVKVIWAETGLNLNNENWEIPNADIIYTFDNDIINEYYRRE